MKKRTYLRPIWVSLALTLLFITAHLVAAALSSAESRKSIDDAALHLVQFCNDPKVGLDEQDIATLADYVLSSKNNKEHPLPESQGCPGAYQEFDTKSNFRRIMQYSYNARIPSVVTRPSSLRYSLWRVSQDQARNLSGDWHPIPANGAPVILHGLQHDSNTPDLSTGVYYEYDLKRTLIWINYKGRQALVSVSKQIDKSNVGEKGLILGPDSDWNYYYSGEPGSARAGLGWIKSYIYDYFSVNVYVETGTAPAMVRTGVFQWIRAGWSGINFVQPGHIIDGLKRFARNNRMIMESPRLPVPNRVMTAYQGLLNMPAGDLINKYTMLQQARRSSALQTGKIGTVKAGESFSFSKTSKEQMVEELMLEYLKAALGKPTPLGIEFMDRISSL
ncbi:MAG: hypothetical protein V1766_04715 [Pseudomonadota bacterium]